MMFCERSCFRLRTTCILDTTARSHDGPTARTDVHAPTDLAASVDAHTQSGDRRPGRPSSEPAWSDTGVRPRYDSAPTRRSDSGLARRVSNPTLSQTDDVVNRIHEAERNLKDVRRDQWLEMNRASASNVLASIGSELPSHLAEVSNPAYQSTRRPTLNTEPSRIRTRSCLDATHGRGRRSAGCPEARCHR